MQQDVAGKQPKVVGCPPEHEEARQCQGGARDDKRPPAVGQVGTVADVAGDRLDDDGNADAGEAQQTKGAAADVAMHRFAHAQRHQHGVHRTPQQAERDRVEVDAGGEPERLGT